MQARSLQDEFLRVIENTRDIIGLYDVAGKRLYMNAPGRQWVDGLQEDERSDPFVRIHPEDRDRIRAEFAEMVLTGETRRLEFRALTLDGSILLMQSEASPVRDQAGRVIAVLSIARNVTDERRGEAVLKATVATLFETTAVGICITDTEGRHLRANARLQEILGYSEAELKSRTVWDLTLPADRPRVGKLRADLLAGRIDRFTVEKRIVRPGGEIRWVICYTAIVRPPLGGASFTVEIVDDITERKRVDEALREREELLEAIFDHAPVGIAITDMDARYLRANPRFRRMLGYSEEELYRLTGWDLLHEADMETNRRLREELFAGVRPDYTWERRYIRKNGEVLWAQNTVALIRDAQGAPRYAIALVEDITRRRLADAAIHATAEKLQALSRRLVDLQEAERRDIARELHDRVGQTLTAGAPSRRCSCPRPSRSAPRASRPPPRCARAS